jgi:hypothetical protein
MTGYRSKPRAADNHAEQAATWPFELRVPQQVSADRAVTFRPAGNLF